MRIALSSSSFRGPLATGDLTQLEWIERCASELGADGVVAAVAHFPRTDPEYVAQLRKVAVDLGVVPFGLDAPALLAPTAAPGTYEDTFALAAGFGALVVRTVLPPPGEIPPASFVEAVAAAKSAAKAAKAANITVLIAEAPGTLGPDAVSVKHLLKDVDSAWLRGAPTAAGDGAAWTAKDRFPARVATTGDDPAAVRAAGARSWTIVDAREGTEPWEELGAYLNALRA